MGCCLSKTDENQDKMFDPNTCQNENVESLEGSNADENRDNTCPNDYQEFQEQFSNQKLFDEIGGSGIDENISGKCSLSFS